MLSDIEEEQSNILSKNFCYNYAMNDLFYYCAICEKKKFIIIRKNQDSKFLLCDDCEKLVILFPELFTCEEKNEFERVFKILDEKIARLKLYTIVKCVFEDKE